MVVWLTVLDEHQELQLTECIAPAMSKAKNFVISYRIIIIVLIINCSLTWGCQKWWHSVLYIMDLTLRIFHWHFASQWQHCAGNLLMKSHSHCRILPTPPSYTMTVIYCLTPLIRFILLWHFWIFLIALLLQDQKCRSNCWEQSILLNILIAKSWIVKYDSGCKCR